MSDENETAAVSDAPARATCPECHRPIREHEMDARGVPAGEGTVHRIYCPSKLVVVLAENEEAARVAANMHGEELGKGWVYLPDAAGAAGMHPNGWGLLLLDSFKKRADAEEIRVALRAVGFTIASPAAPAPSTKGGTP